MGNFISVPVIKYDGVDYSKTESAGYKTVGLATDHVIYARDIETKGGSTASQTATGDKITITGHGLSVDDAIYFTVEIEPSNILANRVYYVQAVHDANTISVADAQEMVQLKLLLMTLLLLLMFSRLKGSYLC